jgi:hypothetical protein
MKAYNKSPAAALDYVEDYLTYLGADTISTSTWTGTGGITKNSDSKTSTTTTVWFSGGTAGQNYLWTNRIITAAGRTDERSIIIRVEQQ